MDRVFIVTSGEYSSYSIDSVWTTREAAEKAAGDYGEVGEWLLNDLAERSVLLWRAILRADGSVVVDDKAQTFTGEVPSTSVWRPWRPTGRTLHSTFEPPQGVGYGPSPEHARKALSDALAAFKAKEAGL